MIALRERRAEFTPFPELATLLTEEYYEIVKEIITGILSTDGWKSTSHELLIGYVAKFYPQLTGAEIALLD